MMMIKYTRATIYPVLAFSVTRTVFACVFSRKSKRRNDLGDVFEYGLFFFESTHRHRTNHSFCKRYKVQTVSIERHNLIDY